MKKWQKDELDSAILDYLNFLPKKEMEIKYNRTIHNIAVKMHSINITRGYNLIKLNNEKIISDYLSNISIDKIALDNNVCNDVINRILKENNVQKRRITKKYQFNENYFKTIDSEKKAYFLGFLFADGCNITTESKIRIIIHKKDISILEKFKIELENNRPIIIKKDYAILTINSPIISKDLFDLGCVNKKTLILKFPTNIPDHLINHFIRGYFDGDGCICYSCNKLHFNTVSTLEFLEKLQNIFVEEIGLNKTKIDKSGKARIIRYSGNNNCHKIMNFLYKDATIYFERKYNIFLKIKNPI